MLFLQKAYQFLCLVFFFLNFHATLSSPSSTSSITKLCSDDEASALIQFKSTFSFSETYPSFKLCGDAGIKAYAKTDSWKEGTNCCDWDGVTCDDIKGQVTGLDLSCSLLYGTIPSSSSLFRLPHLQKLNLAFNNFNASNMSSKFGEFASLEFLNLSRSNFSGQVPSHVSHLSKLVSLDLSGNFYQTFDKPTLEGLVQNLSEVRQLFLEETDMSSINPNVFMNLSSSLRSLDLNRCSLQGKFPETIFQLPNLKLLNLRSNENLILNIPKLNQSSHLEILDLSRLSFSKESIDSISNLQSLKYLNLSETSFLGGFPDSIMNLSSLETLDASSSKFFEELPDSIGNLVSLKHLDFSNSNFMGSIPRSLGNLSQLRFLDLSLNHFSGRIPSSLANLTRLECLFLWINRLEGSLLDEVTAFPNLISLALSYNLLNGTLPSWLYNVSSLKYIDLSDNQFSGQIKEFQYNSLEFVNFKNNKLQGPIPSSVSQLVNLVSLSFSSNNLSGIVDIGMFAKLQNLQSLDLSSNLLSLSSDSNRVDYTLPKLQYLYLSFSNVREFPLFLRGSKSLLHLDLSYNRISGKIPKWMRDVGNESLSYLNLSNNCLTDIEQLPWREIQVLDLRSNLIHGDLPIPPLATYAFLISNNSLSGEISSLICNASSLEFLDLSDNNLSGVIPQCFEDLSASLSLLKLRRNNLGGIIPPIFSKDCQLKNLDLNGNQFEGPLTQSIIDCKGLEVLDLGNNKINATFPHWLGSLPQLQVLVLRSNEFHGSIHDTSSGLSFPEIRIFDIACNYFNGLLPIRYIQNFKAMITVREDILRYMGEEDRYGSFYSYSIEIVMKGVDVVLVKILSILTIIDLSNNKFEGVIPEAIGKLNSLIFLNLSHNNLNGCIPTSVGSLLNLESLDLSSNKLVGTIPEKLTDLLFLEVFNVSGNQLEGQIPQGKQFDAFANDSYGGNKRLCGYPISRACRKDYVVSNSQEIAATVSYHIETCTFLFFFFFFL